MRGAFELRCEVPPTAPTYDSAPPPATLADVLAFEALPEETQLLARRVLLGECPVVGRERFGVCRYCDGAVA